MKKTLLFALAALMLPTAAMADYCTPSGNVSNASAGNDRRFTMVKFTDSNGSNELTSLPGTSYSARAIYTNLTSQYMTSSPGEEVTVDFRIGNNNWVHIMLYIDYNKNEVFDVNLGDQAQQLEGNELVAWTLVCPLRKNSDNTASGTAINGTENLYDMTGTKRGGNDVNANPGSFKFTVPANLPAGEYRCRIKTDYGWTDPCGLTSRQNNTLSANSNQVIDFMLRVEITNHTVVVPEVAADAHYTLTVVADDETLAAGNHTIAAGTMVTINATPEEGYELNGLNINGTTPVTNGVPFALTTDINSIDVAVASLGTPTTVTFVQPEHGTISVTKLGATVANGSTVYSGNQLVVTVTPTGRFELASLKANGVEVATASPFTYTVPEDLAAVEFTAELSLNYASGITYAGTNTNFTPSYVQSATTTDAVVNLDYTATARPANTLNGETGGAVVMDSQITAQRGSTFTLNLNAYDRGAFTSNTAIQDLRYTYCLIFADWNADGVFEFSHRIGKHKDESGFGANTNSPSVDTYKWGNYDSVMKIAQELTVPEDAANTARIRVIYQNAWKIPVNTTGYDVVIEDGIAYDIVVNTVAATVNPTVTISGVTTGAHPEGTATYGIGGEIVITTEPMTEAGVLAGTVLARLNSHPTESTATSFSVEEGTTVYVNAISDFKYASVEEGQENPWATLDELVINVGGVLVAPSEEGYDKAYLNDYENDIIKVDGRYCVAVEVTGNMTVSARFASDAQLSGLENVAVEAANAPAVYFNIQGVRVSEDNMAPGIYVRRQGNKVAKVLVK